MEHINILIVEDALSEAKELRETLERNNFNVIANVDNYRDAMNILINKPVDLAILDIYLGNNPDGLNIAEAIDLMPDKQKPFMFLTSSNDRKIFERAKLTKPFSYTIKPFNELELIYAIEQAIERFYEQPNALSTEDSNAVVSNEYLFIKKGKSLKKVNIVR